MNSLAELILAYRAGSLPLSAVFEALTRRGVVAATLHAEERALLERLRDGGVVDARIIAVLLAKLASIQAGTTAQDQTIVRPATESDKPRDDDATVVQPVTRPPDDDATVVNPATTTPRPPAARDDDATVVHTSGTVVPPAGAGPSDDITRVQSPAAGVESPVSAPADTQTAGTTATAGGSTASQSSTWQRVASAEGGDYVAVGSLLKGRFYLEKEIGRGGMGVVYKARDERKVEARDRDPYLAVKVLNDEFRRHPDSLIALQRESRRSQQLAHDNIVRVFDFDKDGTIVFMTMEYIDGSDLKGVIRDKAYNGMPTAEARFLIEGMARGLARAHADGVVHSDFKPGNVMVTRGGVPKVFDFGIARAGKMGDAAGEQTVFDAATLGALTPAYASLEMIQGREPEAADDIYALGCVAFELLTGKHPFDKLSAETAQKEGRLPPPVPGLTKRQYKALSASVAFTREQRLKNPMDLVEGLRDLTLRERAMPYLLVGVPAVLVIAGGTWGFLSYRHGAQRSAVVSRFAAEQPEHYADERAAQQALDALDEDDRKRLVIDQSEAIQSYLLGRIDAYWNPDKGRYDYGKAQGVFAFRDKLKLYSPTLDTRRDEVDKQKNDLLNTLDTQLTAQIQADAIFETQPENAVVTLGRIRAIDPGSALLTNAQLELKYDAAIGKSLADGHIDEAKQRLDVANRFFAGSQRLQQRGVQIDELGRTLAAQQQQQLDAEKAERERAQSVQTLAGLLDHPSNAADWRTQTADAYRAAKKLLDGDPRLAEQATRFRSLLGAQVKDSQTADAKAAIDIAGFSIDLFPGDPVLSSQRQALLDRQNKLAEEAQTKAQLMEKARARIADLLSRPLVTAVWLQDVRTALNDARTQMGADSPDFAAARRSVADTVVKLARERLAANDLDEAERIARAGQQIDGAEPQFPKLLGEVADARTAAKNLIAQAQAQKLADARKTLADLAARPSLTSDWQRAVSTALEALKTDTSPEARHQIDQLGDAIAAEAAKLTSPQQLPQAKLAVDFGLKLVPKSPKLLEQRASLDKLQRETQAKADQESADAEVKSRIESVRSAAAANDIQKARDSLARIRALHPDDPFLKTEGPQLLTGAYLRFAEDTFNRKNYQDAADVLGQGLKVAGDRPELRATKARYDLVAAIRKAGDGPLAQADYDRLRKQLDEVRRTDAAALAALEAGLRQRNQLGEKTLADRLDKLKPAPGAAPAAPLPPMASPPATVPTPAPPGAAPAARPQVGPAKPEADAVTAGEAAPSPPIATGPDPCGKPELVGRGKLCFDTLGERKGPRLVVVPGVEGGRAYALSRTEISIVNFNDFCAATKKCAAKAVEDEDFGNAPVSNITLALARDYAAWLTSASGGYVYRLPTDAEWSHAAKAGGGFKQAEDSNCIPPGASAGTGAPVSAKGRMANAWGLVHMSGNVWEWTVGGGKLFARGASYAEYWSDCTVEARREDSGQAKRDVGFRIVRELK